MEAIAQQARKQWSEAFRAAMQLERKLTLWNHDTGDRLHFD